MRRKITFLYLISILLLASSGTPETVNDSGPTVQSVATDIYRQFLADHKVLTSSESPETETINRISTRVIDAVKNYYTSAKASKELQGFNWEVHLIQQTKIDAWCLPGGKIAVYSSLLPLTQSDASMAVILAHEIAHVFLKHGDARMKQYLKEFLGGKDLAGSLSAKPAETKDFYRMAFGNGDYIGVIRGFSSKDEMEADELAVIFCAMAGYKPEEAIVFWERMTSLRWTGHTPELLSTHPIDDKRIPKLRETIDEIGRIYYKPVLKNGQ
jgi:predicted Zn-dependent protease